MNNLEKKISKLLEEQVDKLLEERKKYLDMLYQENEIEKLLVLYEGIGLNGRK